MIKIGDYDVYFCAEFEYTCAYLEHPDDMVSSVPGIGMGESEALIHLISNLRDLRDTMKRIKSPTPEHESAMKAIDEILEAGWSGTFDN